MGNLNPSPATRFKPGNDGGPGNMRARRAQRQHNVFAKCFSDDDIRDLAAAMLDKAKKGDTQAAALLCKVLFPEKIVERLQEHNTIGQLVLVMPDDGRAGGALHGRPIDDIDDCDIIDAG